MQRESKELVDSKERNKKSGSDWIWTYYQDQVNKDGTISYMINRNQ